MTQQAKYHQLWVFTTDAETGCRVVYDVLEAETVHCIARCAWKMGMLAQERNPHGARHPAGLILEWRYA